MEPSFIHHETVLAGLKEIFNGKTKESVTIFDPSIKTMLCLIPLTENGITLLEGIMGIGKGVSTRAIQKVFFKDQKIGLLQCDPDKRQEESLYETAVTSNTHYNYDKSGQLTNTQQEYDFDPRAMDFVTQPIKFVNEANRASKSLQDTLLRLFQEQELEYKGKIFRSPNPSITIFDQNPVHMQNDGRRLEPALEDRIDVKIPMCAPSLFTIIATQTIKTSDKTAAELPSLLSYVQMTEIYEDIRKVHIKSEDIYLLSAITQLFFACKHRRDIANEIYNENINCKACSFDNGLCAHVKYPIGQRFIESILKFSKTKAWLEKRDTVSIDDIMFIMPYALNHRITLQPETMSKYVDAHTWIVEYAIPKVEQQKQHCLDILSKYQQAIAKPASSIIEEMFKYSRQNMLYLNTLIDILRIYANTSTRDLEDVMSILETQPNDDDFQLLEQRIKSSQTFAMPTDKKPDIQVICDTLSTMVPMRNYEKILSNRESIETLLKKYNERKEKTFKFDKEVFSKQVFPEFVNLGTTKNKTNIQESLTTDVSFTMLSTTITITHQNDIVMVNLKSEKPDSMTKITSILEDIPAYA